MSSMPTFICTRCGAIENTATSDYWLYKFDGKPPICSQCGSGKWHGKFKRQHWSAIGIEALLEGQKLGKGDFINAREHLTDLGVIGDGKALIHEVESDILSSELRFHLSRRIFAYFDGKLNFCDKIGLSHHEWLVDGGLFCDFVFEEMVRGYVDDSGVYFYMGDFNTDEYVEKVAKSCEGYFDKDLPIYCGLKKGKVGERWKPITRVR